jgi:hypothetical protein
VSTSSGYPRHKKSHAGSPGKTLLRKWLKASPVKAKKKGKR